MSDPNLTTQRQIQNLGEQLERLRKVDAPGVSGTWTPSFEGTTGTGTFTYTANRGGRYFLTGSLCWLTARVEISAIVGAPTGAMTITGLPFAASSTAFANGSVAFGDVSNFNYAASAISLQGLILSGEAIIRLIESFDNLASASCPAANFTNAACGLIFTATYEV